MRALPFLLTVSVLACAASPQPQPAADPSPTPATPPAGERLMVFVSDLHFGLGKLPSGAWHPLDDFRWSRALQGFLGEISRLSGGRTTLVIAGDLLELWQHPDLACDAGKADYGCSLEEIEALTERIAVAHAADLEALGSFASDGDNRLVIIPGNHDAALLLPSVRARIESRLKAKPGRVEIPASGDTAGVWASPDGLVVSEHGHQMPGENINGWKKWPVVTGMVGGKERLVRPWGQAFVHGLYDSVETDHELIDNLIPQSNGAKHYMEKKGFFGSVGEVARFLSFNVMHTSFTQITALKILPADGTPVEWDIAASRAKGWTLFAEATGDEWTRKALTNPPDESWTAVRAALDKLALDEAELPEDEVRMLCDRAAARTGRIVCVPKDKTLAISAVKSAIPNAEARALRAHLKKRAAKWPLMQVFVYGHTHVVRCPTPITPKGGNPIQVANTGAFQRLIDDGRFVAEAKRSNVSPAEALSTLKLDALPPCYTAVLVKTTGGRAAVEVKSWFMPEDAAAGSFIPVTDCRCAKLDPKCPGGAPCP